MKRCIFIILFVIMTAIPAMAEPKPAKGNITDVIVYHGRALVTRTVELDKSTGDIELLVENLPSQILPESLYAQADNGIQVLSVRYRVKEIKQDTRTEVKEIEKQIHEIARKLTALEWNRCNVADRIDRFREQWKLNINATNADLNRSVLNAESVIDLTTYLENKSKDLHEEITTIMSQKMDLEEQKKALETKLARLKKGHRKTLRQALVYLNKSSSKSAKLQISYLVNGANWTPQYNLKAEPANKDVNIEYNAVVHQSSGENWTDARLALSTAVPALVATPPALEPFKISLMTGQYNQTRHDAKRPMEGMDMMMQAAEAPARQERYSYKDQTEKFGVLVQNRRQSISKGIRAQKELNQIAISNQMIEFEADKKLLEKIKQKAVAIKRTEGISVMYKLPGKLSLPSKSDQQLVTIASMKCPGAFTYVAAPLLTDYVYLQASITNNSDTIFLPGNADMFRDGQFVGKGDMKLVTTGQSFTTGFGVESQVQVTREFKDKKTESLWGNRVDEHKYRIKIDNYSDKSISLRLMDRLPWTENEELSIELNNLSHTLSKDAEYLRTQQKEGILRWDLTLKPNTTADKATIVSYDFTMKYDNDMSIRNIN